MLLNYHFIIVKNLYILYTQKSISLIVKTLTFYKYYEIFILEAQHLWRPDCRWDQSG
jgi:hypothetical protein